MPHTLLAFGAALLLSACGPDAEELSGTLTDGIDEQGCQRLLSGPATEELTGPQSSHRLHEVGGLPACQALTSGDNGARVTVVRVPAAQWAGTQYWTFMDLLPAHPTDADADPRLLELMESLREKTLPDEDACELFVALAEERHGSAEPLVVSPAALGGLSLLSAQACDGGQFALVTMESAADLELTPERESLLRAAVDELHPGDLAPGD